MLKVKHFSDLTEEEKSVYAVMIPACFELFIDSICATSGLCPSCAFYMVRGYMNELHDAAKRETEH